MIKWGWVLITLYMGPIALALYVLTDKEPGPGSTTASSGRCGSRARLDRALRRRRRHRHHRRGGDHRLLGLPMWFDLIVEYVAGFVFGLFIFQALFMKDMFGGSLPDRAEAAFVPEWLSMNMMMAGMFPMMVLLMMGRDMRAMDPREPLFWAVMSLGVIVGFFDRLSGQLVVVAGTEARPDDRAVPRRSGHSRHRRHGGHEQHGVRSERDAAAAGTVSRVADGSGAGAGHAPVGAATPTSRSAPTTSTGRSCRPG